MHGNGAQTKGFLEHGDGFSRSARKGERGSQRKVGRSGVGTEGHAFFGLFDGLIELSEIHVGEDQKGMDV